MNHEKDEQSFLSNLKSKIQENSFQGFFKNHLQLKNNTRNSRNSRTAHQPEFLERFQKRCQLLAVYNKDYLWKEKSFVIQ